MSTIPEQERRVETLSVCCLPAAQMSVRCICSSNGRVNERWDVFNLTFLSGGRTHRLIRPRRALNTCDSLRRVGGRLLKLSDV